MSNSVIDQQGFVLSRHWRDTRQGVELVFWLSTPAGPVQLVFPGQEMVFFVVQTEVIAADELLQVLDHWQRKSVSMHSFSGEAIQAYYFTRQRTLREARDILLANGLSPLESDINPYDRFLMERFIRGSMRFRSTGVSKTRKQFQKIVSPEVAAGEYAPQFKVLSLDIETTMEGLELYSIGLYADNGVEHLEKVFMVSTEEVDATVEIFSDEKQLLIAFLDWLDDYDPDIIIGWNVINFDMWYLQRVCDVYQLPLRVGRGRSKAHWRMVDEDRDRRALNIPGRVVLDGIELLRVAAYRFESFSLNNVAQVLLHDSKLIVGSGRGGKITELFQHDKEALARYNIQDCKLVWDIFEKTDLLQFAIARSQLTGLPLERMGGSVASFDFRYLPLLHRESYVAPNNHLTEEIEHSPGGFVMNSTPGIFDHVLVLDFKSLYPSIIRSFKIDPLGMALGTDGDLDQSELVPGFKGAWFSRQTSILPEVIEQLWRSRDEAKASNDGALSQAIKILMNSFYGVLGASGCRFFDARLTSSITLRGHQIMQETAAFIERDSDLRSECEVIYGDTDSVFVWLREVTTETEALAKGKILERQLNHWWQARLQKDYQLDCALEIEFETHFKRFLMPTIRGSDKGSKKRYAGVVIEDGVDKLVFKGLENVRTDWTRLAREFQLELYRRIFFEEPYRDYIKSIVAGVLSGSMDDQLIYRKRLRRRLDEYQRNVPPQVQAARKAVSQAGLVVRKGDWVDYIITINGAEPTAAQPSMIDYQHYIDRQLAPVADGILYFKKETFADIIDQQMGLFG